MQCHDGFCDFEAFSVCSSSSISSDDSLPDWVIGDYDMGSAWTLCPQLVDRYNTCPARLLHFERQFPTAFSLMQHARKRKRGSVSEEDDPPLNQQASSASSALATASSASSMSSAFNDYVQSYVDDVVFPVQDIQTTTAALQAIGSLVFSPTNPICIVPVLLNGVQVEPPLLYVAVPAGDAHFPTQAFRGHDIHDNLEVQLSPFCACEPADLFVSGFDRLTPRFFTNTVISEFSATTTAELVPLRDLQHLQQCIHHIVPDESGLRTFFLRLSRIESRAPLPSSGAVSLMQHSSRLTARTPAGGTSQSSRHGISHSADRTVEVTSWSVVHQQEVTATYANMGFLQRHAHLNLPVSTSSPTVSLAQTNIGAQLHPIPIFQLLAPVELQGALPPMIHVALPNAELGARMWTRIFPWHTITESLRIVLNREARAFQTEVRRFYTGLQIFAIVFASGEAAAQTCQ